MTAPRLSLDAEALWLYRRSREFYEAGNIDAAEAIYRRIRREHCLEAFYEIELPSVMRLVHPLGSVLGRAKYADGLVVYQGVSVGSTVDGERPAFKGPCVLFPGAAVIGNVVVGDNVWISARTKIEALPGQTIEIEPYSVVFPIMRAKARDGMFEHTIGHASRRTTHSVMERFFPEAQK